MSDDHAIPWITLPVAWAVGVLGDMPPNARGIYVSLLLVAAQRGPLPTDRAALARLAGCTLRELARAWPAIAPYWEAREGGLVSAHVEGERQRYVERREDLRERGRRGVEKRWQQARAAGGDEIAPAIATAIAPAIPTAIAEPYPDIHTVSQPGQPGQSEQPDVRTRASLGPAREPTAPSQVDARPRVDDGTVEQGRRVHARLTADEAEYDRRRRAH